MFGDCMKKRIKISVLPLEQSAIEVLTVVDKCRIEKWQAADAEGESGLGGQCCDWEKEASGKNGVSGSRLRVG